MNKTINNNNNNNNHSNSKSNRKTQILPSATSKLQTLSNSVKNETVFMYFTCCNN